MQRRRITNKSIGQSLSVTSLAYASAAPAPARPFCFGGGPDLNLCRSLGRYTDGKNGSAAPRIKPKWRFAQAIVSVNISL
jgi:hypothetical protein